jgi:hypothetical protein
MWWSFTARSCLPLIEGTSAQHYGETAYNSIVKVMRLRESIRSYVSAVMAEANKTGVSGSLRGHFGRDLRCPGRKLRG